jgi:hypothetical protein
MLSLARDLHLSLDAVSFARAAGFEPDQWQAGLLADPPRRGLLCCSRQSGKSTTVSLLALHVASFEPDSLVVLVAPAQRQSAELLRTIRSMHRASTACPSCAAIVCCASKWRMARAFSRCPATAAVKRFAA